MFANWRSGEPPWARRWPPYGDGFRERRFNVQARIARLLAEGLLNSKSLRFDWRPEIFGCEWVIVRARFAVKFGELAPGQTREDLVTVEVNERASPIFFGFLLLARCF